MCDEVRERCRGPHPVRRGDRRPETATIVAVGSLEIEHRACEDHRGHLRPMQTGPVEGDKRTHRGAGDQQGTVTSRAVRPPNERDGVVHPVEGVVVAPRMRPRGDAGLSPAVAEVARQAHEVPVESECPRDGPPLGPNLVRVRLTGGVAHHHAETSGGRPLGPHQSGAVPGLVGRVAPDRDRDEPVVVGSAT